MGVWRTRKDKTRPESWGRETFEGLVEAEGPMSGWRKCWAGKARTGWLQKHQRKGVSEEVSRAAEAEQDETGHLVLVTKRSVVTLASWALSLENGVWDPASGDRGV